MFGRVRAWIRGLAELATVIQLVGSVGGATVIAILVPALLQTALDLPLALRVVLGVGLFFVALAVILAILKAVLERAALASKPGGRAASDQYLLRAEIREQERERQQLLSKIGQLEAEIEHLQNLNERLAAEKAALQERIDQTSDLLEAQPDEELGRRFFQLSGELFRFADERDETDPQKNPEQTPGFFKRSQKGGDHDDETRVQYAKQFGGEVGALLDIAEQRNWIERQERQKLEENVKATFRLQTPTTYIREIAQRLERFGHRI